MGLVMIVFTFTVISDLFWKEGSNAWAETGKEDVVGPNGGGHEGVGGDNMGEFVCLIPDTEKLEASVGIFLDPREHVPVLVLAAGHVELAIEDVVEDGVIAREIDDSGSRVETAAADVDVEVSKDLTVELGRNAEQ